MVAGHRLPDQSKQEDSAEEQREPGAGDDPDRFLMDLLWKAGISPRLFPRAARTAIVADSIPEALIQAFADDLLRRLQWGAPRRYYERAEESQRAEQLRPSYDVRDCFNVDRMNGEEQAGDERRHCSSPWKGEAG